MWTFGFCRPRSGSLVRLRASCAVGVGVVAWAATVGSAGELEQRVRLDAAQQRPLVAHVVVALCDNLNQGIVPVPRLLGNGQDPARNLYWGAQYGVRTYFTKATGWKAVACTTAARPGVIARAAFRWTGSAGPGFVVADAWDGARIREALRVYLEMTSGREVEPLVVDGVELHAGGGAHVVAFVGHNGLMDFAPPSVAAGSAKPARAAIVLACASRPYFGGLLSRAGAYPLLLTTGLMAPEAYTLEAAVRTWFSSAETGAVREAAAGAYDKHQGCGMRAARRLFSAP
jgi:hypothetical protein